jgi:hypothetical protein
VLSFCNGDELATFDCNSLGLGCSHINDDWGVDCVAEPGGDCLRVDNQEVLQFGCPPSAPVCELLAPNASQIGSCEEGPRCAAADVGECFGDAFVFDCFGVIDGDDNDGQPLVLRCDERGATCTRGAGCTNEPGASCEELTRCISPSGASTTPCPPNGTCPEGVRFRRIEVGTALSCGVKESGALACWSNDDRQQASPPGGSFRSVSAGGLHGCGVRDDGRALCWGINFQNQTRAPEEDVFIDVEASHGAFSCGVRDDQSIVCWGNDAPEGFEAVTGTFVDVSAGLYHACALRDDDTVACWGSDFGGSTAPPGGRFLAVSAGDTHSCGVRGDGSLTCWGTNDFGESEPPSGTFTAVSAGSKRTCALRADGAVRCWGLGDELAPPESEHFTAVATGYAHACGLRGSGLVTCWGADRAGETLAP